MKQLGWLFGTLFFFLSSLAFAAEECIPFEKAKDHVGEAKCVEGKIVAVGRSKSTWYLDYCEDYKTCPFVVVVFERDLKDASKLKQLEGQTVKIFGPIKLYNGRPEIILWHEHQLTGEPTPETARDRTKQKSTQPPRMPLPRTPRYNSHPKKR